MQKELHSQGADTERLQDIANQLAQLEKELSFIKENATLVIEYQKDKRDLIDRIPGWQREHDEQKTSAPIGTGNAESGNILPTRKNRPSEQRMGRSGRKCKGTAKRTWRLTARFRHTTGINRIKIYSVPKTRKPCRPPRPVWN